MAAMVDRFIHIIESNSLKPDEIEKVEITPHAIGINRMWKENNLETEEDFGFNGPYCIACAAYRLKGADFQNPDTRKDPNIREFMKKVKVLPDYHKDFGLSILEDPITRVMSVEVWAKGKRFKETSRYIDWSWYPDDIKATDDDLAGKFRELVSGFLQEDKIEKAIAMLFSLEQIDNLNDLMETLVP